MSESSVRHNLKLLQSGHSFFEGLVRLIDEAREEIHFQTYIFEKDETGLAVAKALLKAASRGVKVFLLLDAYGSGKLPKDFSEELKAAGIQLKFYGPIFAHGSFHIGRRLHRKVIVIDGKKAIVGGINISNHYNDVNNKKAWLDFAVLVEGNIVHRLREICLQLWQKKRFRKLPKIKLRRDNPSFSGAGEASIRIRQNDWVRRLKQAYSTYRRQIKASRHSLVFVGGYFFPGGRVRHYLKKAVRRGVKIKIVLAAESDVALLRNAVEYLYQWMLRNGIHIYEYQPANVHGKVLISDTRFVSIGSYDLNNLSNYSNIELNLDIADSGFAHLFQGQIEKIIQQDCRRITKDELYKRENLWKRFKHWFCYQLVKSLFVLAFWLSNDDDDYQ